MGGGGVSPGKQQHRGCLGGSRNPSFPWENFAGGTTALLWSADKGKVWLGRVLGNALLRGPCSEEAPCFRSPLSI